MDNRLTAEDLFDDDQLAEIKKHEAIQDAMALEEIEDILADLEGAF